MGVDASSGGKNHCAARRSSHNGWDVSNDARHLPRRASSAFHTREPLFEVLATTPRRWFVVRWSVNGKEQGLVPFVFENDLIPKLTMLCLACASLMG